MKNNDFDPARCFVFPLPIRHVAFFAILFAAMKLGSAQGAPEREATPIRKLSGKERTAANTARDKADQLRADFEKNLSTLPRPTSDSLPKSNDSDANPAALVAIRSYEDVIKTYPRTEVAAYCTKRLAGVYGMLSNFDKAAHILEAAAADYAGTDEGLKLVFETGLIHAQARNDQPKAIDWFSRIPKPADTSESPADRKQMGPNVHLKYYILAQQQLAKCELQLGMDRKAEGRIIKAGAEHPQYEKKLTRFHELELKIQRPNSQKTVVKPSAMPFHMILVWQFSSLLVVGLAIAVIRHLILQRKK